MLWKYLGVEGDSTAERIVFRVLDDESRTDTWLSDEEEIEHGADPQDPDTDDEWLTDGQEVVHATEYSTTDSVSVDAAAAFNTNPAEADTDGDGCWDGWSGVYDVERTDDVVLDVENLHTGGGIAGDDRERTNRRSPGT